MINPDTVGELLQGEPPTSPSELARALASLRRRTTAVCEVCGAEFETWERKTQQARTCSNKCRQALFRRQQKQDAE